MTTDAPAALHPLVTAVPVPLCVVTPDGRLVEWNDAFARCIPLASSEVCGQPLASVWDDEVPEERLHRSLQQALQTDEPVWLDSETADGRWHLRAVRMPSGLWVALTHVPREHTPRDSETHLPPDVGWQHLVEAHLDPILITQKGIIRYVNPSGARLFGTTPDALVGQPILDFVHPSAHPKLIARMRRIGAWRRTTPFRHRILTMRGETRTVEAFSVPIQYEGEPAAQTVIRDVTEWEAAQAGLRHRTLLNTLIVDLSTRLVDAASNLTDAHIEEALGNIGQFVGADRSYVFLVEGRTFSNTHEWCAPDVSSEKETLQNLRTRDFPWLFAQLREDPPLHVPDVCDLPPAAAFTQAILEEQDIQSLVIVPFAHDDDLIGFVGFDAVHRRRAWPDDTIMLLQVLADTVGNALARQRTEQALRAREATYRTVVHNVRDIVFQLDLDGRWTFLNSAWQTVTGYAPENSLGAPCAQHLDGDDLPDVHAIDIGTDWECRCEVQLHTRSGDVRWMACFAQSIAGDDGTPSGIVGTLHDITERKRMEQQTREALERERELHQLQARVVSMISHEFRTPLSTLRSSAEMLARYIDQWPSSKRDKYLARIQTHVERMSRLLGDVITTSKLEAQHSAPEWTGCSLRRFFQDVVDEVRSGVAPNQPVALEFDAPTDDVPVDEDLLYHIFSNLLSNALKYSHETVRITVCVTDATVHLSVRDRGVGIPPEDQSHLMQPFYRGTNVGATDGSGLGMTIVQRAVDAYGGTVSFESVHGRGTRFEVSLPLPSHKGLPPPDSLDPT